jgi:hypothetical protein
MKLKWKSIVQALLPEACLLPINDTTYMLICKGVVVMQGGCDEGMDLIECIVGRSVLYSKGEDRARVFSTNVLIEQRQVSQGDEGWE